MVNERIKKGRMFYRNFLVNNTKKCQRVMSREVCDRDEGPQETRRSLIQVRGKSRSVRRARCCRSTSALLFSSEVKRTVNVAVSDRPWGVAGAEALAAH